MKVLDISNEVVPFNFLVPAKDTPDGDANDVTKDLTDGELVALAAGVRVNGNEPTSINGSFISRIVVELQSKILPELSITLIDDYLDGSKDTAICLVSLPIKLPQNAKLLLRHFAVTGASGGASNVIDVHGLIKK